VGLNDAGRLHDCAPGKSTIAWVCFGDNGLNRAGRGTWRGRVLEHVVLEVLADVLGMARRLISAGSGSEEIGRWHARKTGKPVGIVQTRDGPASAGRRNFRRGLVT